MSRFDQFKANLNSLEDAYNQDLSNPFIISGIVEQFAVEFELGWKVLREMALDEGSLETKTGSPRAIIKTAFVMFPFLDGDLWLDMLTDRNTVLHLYSESSARAVAKRVLEKYIPAFRVLRDEIDNRLRRN